MSIIEVYTEYYVNILSTTDVSKVIFCTIFKESIILVIADGHFNLRQCRKIVMFYFTLQIYTN